MSADKPENYDAWVGRTEEGVDQITPTPMRAPLAAPAPPPPHLPPLWHWLYFLPGERQSNIGPDGHPKRGGFLPPVSLPRRMWAGGRLQFLRSLAVGEAVRRVSLIKSVNIKAGR